jgi:hypothetical protein
LLGRRGDRLLLLSVQLQQLQLEHDNLTNALPLEEERGRRSNLSVEQETFRSG